MANRNLCQDERPCALRDEFWGCKALSELPDGVCRFAKPTMDSLPYVILEKRNDNKREGEAE